MYSKDTREEKLKQLLEEAEMADKARDARALRTIRAQIEELRANDANVEGDYGSKERPKFKR